MQTKIILFLVFNIPFLVYAQTNHNPEKFEAAICKFEKSDSINPPKQNGTLFLGSSSIRKWKDAETFFQSYNAINRGFGGSHWSDLLYYFDRIVTPYHPKIIVLYEGDNDFAHGKTIERVTSDLQLFIAKVKRVNAATHIVLISVKPSIRRWNLSNIYCEYNNFLRQVAQGDSNIHFIDIWTSMLDSDGRPNVNYFSSDSLHMNAAGYQIWNGALQKLFMEFN